MIPAINPLKPCAHCGSTDIAPVEIPANLNPLGEIGHMNSCQDCGMSTACFSTKEEADEVWNLRANIKN